LRWRAVPFLRSLSPLHLPRWNQATIALIELAKEAKRKGNLSREEAKTLIQWAKEYGVTGRGPEMHVKRIFNKLHIHIGPVDHINVLPK
jgi:hypothetical protein